MERHFVFFRCWEHFSPDSDLPIQELDDLPDDKINDAVEACAVNWPREHKSEFDRRVRDRGKRLVAKSKKREKQLTPRPASPGELTPADSRRVSSFMPRRPSKLEPGLECSLGCRNAWAIGWITTALRKFEGWSPSPKCFLMRVDEARFAANIVAALTEWWPTSEPRILYAHFNPCFGHGRASQFAPAVQAVINAGMDRLLKLRPADVRDVLEEFQQLVADQAMELGRQLVGICNSEPGQPETPPPVVAKSKQVGWFDDADGFISLSDALKILDNDIVPTLSASSKLLTPDGPIRYMRRKGVGCKVHVTDWLAHFKSKPRQPGDSVLFERVDQYVEEVEDRKRQEHERKTDGHDS